MRAYYCARVPALTRRSPIGFFSCLAITTALAIFLLRFMWPAFLMGAVMLGITTPGEIAAAIIGVMFIGAARCARG